MIDAADASAKPVVFWCCEAELRIEDDEFGAHARVEEAGLVTIPVVGAAGEAEVLGSCEQDDMFGGGRSLPRRRLSSLGS